VKRKMLLTEGTVSGCRGAGAVNGGSNGARQKKWKGWDLSREYERRGEVCTKRGRPDGEEAAELSNGQRRNVRKSKDKATKGGKEPEESEADGERLGDFAIRPGGASNQQQGTIIHRGWRKSRNIADLGKKKDFWARSNNSWNYLGLRGANLGALHRMEAQEKGEVPSDIRRPEN